MSTAELAEKIWTISDLQILHQLQTPVFVAAFGMYSVSHRSVSRSFLLTASPNPAVRMFVLPVEPLLCRCSADNLRPAARVLFQNAECLKRYGAPRCVASSAEVVDSQDEATHMLWQSWSLQTHKVLMLPHKPAADQQAFHMHCAICVLQSPCG